MVCVTQPAVPEQRPDTTQLRASDADRQAVVEQLREAHAEGRLDLTEFDDRTRSAYAARTYADLVPLTADLPAQPAAAVSPPSVADQPVATALPHRTGMVWKIVGSAWFFASFVNLVIWAIVCIASWDWIYPWWVWVAGPWGAVLLARWLSERGRQA
jgi:Domain of unknown function (DUF1707)